MNPFDYLAIAVIIALFGACVSGVAWYLKNRHHEIELLNGDLEEHQLEDKASFTATNAAIQASQTRIDEKINSLRLEMKQDIAEIKREIKEEIIVWKDDIKNDLARLQAAISSPIHLIKSGKIRRRKNEQRSESQAMSDDH